MKFRKKPVVIEAERLDEDACWNTKKDWRLKRQKERGSKNRCTGNNTNKKSCNSQSQNRSLIPASRVMEQAR